MLLYYVRHGEPVYEPDGLTELGKRQAEAVAKRLALYGVDEIFASSSQRAQDTAKPTSELTHKPIKVLDWCNEALAAEDFYVNDADGRRWVYLDKASCEKFISEEVYSLGDKWYEHEYFKGTRYEKGIERIKYETFMFLKSLGYEYCPELHCYKAVKPNDARIALFAHEGFGMAFLSTVLGIPYPLFCTHFGLEHSGVTVIKFDGKEKVIPIVLQLSCDSHLYKEGLPTKYNGELFF